MLMQNFRWQAKYIMDNVEVANEKVIFQAFHHERGGTW